MHNIGATVSVCVKSVVLNTVFNLQKAVSLLKISGYSLNSKACLPAWSFVLRMISRDPLSHVDILWLNCLKSIKVFFLCHLDI